MRRFIGYTLPFSAFAIPSSLVCYGDRWVLQHSLTAADVGIYVAIAQIASAPANLLLAVFSYTLNPFLFQQAGDARCAEALQRSRQLLYRGVLLLVVVLAGVILVSVLLDTWIVRLLTSAEFVPYARLLWLLVLAAALFQIAQALTSEAYVHDRPWSMMAPKLIHAALFVVLAVAWVGPHQLMGVALAAVISAAVYLWLVVAANRRARYGNMHRAAGGLR
jgi:O-antigen/teichoic acid export membrane protein